MDEGRFRADLYYRLNVLRITLPPLRDRREDIIPLAEAFLREFNVLFSKKFEAIAAPTRKFLEEYAWPGNVRELRNIIERIALIETGDTMIPDHLPQEILTAGAMKACLPSTSEFSNARLLRVERDCIIQALERTGGNVLNAARLLGVKRGALRYRMDKLGISKDDFVPRSPED
jgi:transcriptional regulator with PAS, ATPase and Fis domain